jgi:hypothetical protein
MNISDIGDIFPKDEEKIISNHLLLESDKMFSECDFHIGEKDENHMTSSIPITLKNKNFDKEGPYLILFYYDDNEPVLEEWKKVFSNPFISPYLNLKCVNLDYETKIYDTFKNLSISNPFKWAKIKDEEKKYFVIFYLDTLPQEFYKGILEPTVIISQYNDFQNKFQVSTSSRIKEIKDQKTKIFESLRFKDNYFKALEDDYPVTGIKKNKYYKIVYIGENEYKFLEVK